MEKKSKYSTKEEERIAKRLIEKKYKQAHRNKVNEGCKRRYWNDPLNRFKRSIRKKTIWKYGKLEPSFCYHHYTEPYEVDKVFILEKHLHIWMHFHPESFKLGELYNINKMEVISKNIK